MSRCVIDTDVVIAALDRVDAHDREAATALRSMTGAGVALGLSPVSYVETLVRPAEAAGIAWAPALR